MLASITTVRTWKTHKMLTTLYATICRNPPLEHLVVEPVQKPMVEPLPVQESEQEPKMRPRALERTPPCRSRHGNHLSYPQNPQTIPSSEI